MGYHYVDYGYETLKLCNPELIIYLIKFTSVQRSPISPARKYGLRTYLKLSHTSSQGLEFVCNYMLHL